MLGNFVCFGLRSAEFPSKNIFQKFIQEYRQKCLIQICLSRQHIQSFKRQRVFKDSEYDQEIPQLHTAYQPTATRGRAT